ncbi:hypothetical protein BS17DRAFT_126483 [Gyrodon lividus]|nr:hypothetical protein BS17DRAFT_126483 [Gyrodon lividus]
MDKASDAATLIRIAQAAQKTLAAGLHYAKHYTNAKRSCKQLQDDLKCVLHTANIAIGALNRPSSLGNGPNIDDRLVQWFSSNEPQTCLDTLNGMEGLITGYNSTQKFFKTLRFAVCEEDKIKEAIALFDKHRAYFHFLLTTDIWSGLADVKQRQKVAVGPIHVDGENREIQQGVKTMQRDVSTAMANEIAEDRKEKKGKVNRNEVVDFLQWLNELDCTGKHEDTSAVRQAETCTWLPETDVYRSWRRGDVSSLWLEGKPGSGKSVLASFIINDLQHSRCDGEVLVFFYCDFRNVRSISAPEVMRSLLAQLLRLVNVDIDCRDAVPELVERKARNAEPPNDMKLLARLVCCAAKLHRRPFIIIDALDECQDIEKLLNALQMLNDGQIRLFVTSRPEQIIRERLSNLPSISLQKMISAVSADMERHITKVLDSHRLLRMLEPGLKKEIRFALLQAADGMFRWVQCQIDSLAQCTSAGEIRTTLISLPIGLDETYERILRMIDGKEFQGKLVRRALVWLIAALRPLQLPDIIEALKIDLERRTLNDDSGPMNETIFWMLAGVL